MLQRARSLGALVLLALGLGGCPVTDDYFIETGPVTEIPLGGTAAGGGNDSTGSGGSEQAGSSVGGGPAGGSGAAAGSGGGDVAAAGEGGGSAGEAATCLPSTERCNGHDDNCNGVVDEQACNNRANGTTGCVGFVIDSRPDHGYMLCPTTAKTYADAQQACEQQSMRLAWLETKAENDGVSAKVSALTADEVTFGANDIDDEGTWVWDGIDGFQFWKGDETGKVVDAAFSAWAPGTPNDDNGGEDCAVLNPVNGVWGDRACATQYPYLCEEPE
jgi:hypothetical protein